MARRFADAGKAALFVVFCLSLSLFVLVTDSEFTFSALQEKAVGPTRQYLDFVFGAASFPDVFSGSEASHMRDVAWLLRVNVLVMLLSAAGIVKWVKIDELIQVSRNGISVFFVAGLISAIVPFESVFRVFHLVFFPQGNWMFPSDSVLILFYPQEFFAWYAACWVVYAVFTAGVLALFGRFLSE